MIDLYGGEEMFTHPAPEALRALGTQMPEAVAVEEQASEHQLVSRRLLIRSSTSWAVVTSGLCATRLSGADSIRRDWRRVLRICTWRIGSLPALVFPDVLPNDCAQKESRSKRTSRNHFLILACHLMRNSDMPSQMKEPAPSSCRLLRGTGGRQCVRGRPCHMVYRYTKNLANITRPPVARRSGRGAPRRNSRWTRRRGGSFLRAAGEERGGDVASW